MSEFLGKGSNPRPYSTTREERDLRDSLAYGHITFAQFEIKYNKLLKDGKLKRNGRTIK